MKLHRDRHFTIVEDARGRLYRVLFSGCRDRSSFYLLPWPPGEHSGRYIRTGDLGFEEIAQAEAIRRNAVEARATGPSVGSDCSQ